MVSRRCTWQLAARVSFLANTEHMFVPSRDAHVCRPMLIGKAVLDDRKVDMSAFASLSRVLLRAE